MARNTVAALELNEGDRLLDMLPLFHLQGLLSALAQFAAGGSVVCCSGFDPAAWPGWMNEYRPTWYTAGPALHKAIATLVAQQRPELPACLRFIRSSSAYIHPHLLETVEREMGVVLLQAYGMTETGGVTCDRVPPHKREPGSVGRGMGPEIRIIGEDGTPLGPGQEGQIAVRGPSVTPGYWAGAGSRYVPFAEGWLCTGDIGVMNDDGFLYLTGRNSDFINRGGEKIRPEEIDAALESHPAVAEAAAFAASHPSLGEDVACAVVMKAGLEFDEAELRRFLSQQLPPSKVPRRLMPMDQIPRGVSRKPLRRLLANSMPAEQSQSQARIESPEELRIREIWRRLLSIPGVIPADADFFSIGGDSMSAMVMLLEVSREFSIDLGRIAVSRFLDTPTVSGLAGILQSTGEPASDHVIALHSDGDQTPVFFVVPAADEVFYVRHLARRLGRPFFVLRTAGCPQTRGSRAVEEAALKSAAEVMRRLPEGRFILAGHSFGGVVAFETASRLIAAGRTVDRLVLFDTPAPGYPKPLRNIPAYARRVVEMRRKPVSLREAVRHSYVALRLLARNAAARIRHVFPDTVIDRLLGERGGIPWAPGVLSIPVIHFIARDQIPPNRILEDPRLSWRHHASAGFTVRRVPGTHSSIFSEAHAAGLATEMNALLDSGAAPRVHAEWSSGIPHQPTAAATVL